MADKQQNPSNVYYLLLHYLIIWHIYNILGLIDRIYMKAIYYEFRLNVLAQLGLYYDEHVWEKTQRTK